MELSDVMQGTLPNGMRWIAVSDPGAKSLSFQMLTLAGSRMDPPGKSGLAHVCEHIMFDGTTKHTAEELVTQLSQYGGELNAYTSNDVAVYHAKMRGEYLERMVSFFSEILYESVFSEESIEREKEVVLQEVSMRTGSPASSLSTILIPERAWRDTPAAEPVGGREEDIRSITRTDVLHFVEQMYRPEHIVLSLAGDIKDSNGLPALLEQYFNFQVKSTPMPTIYLAKSIRQDETEVYRMNMNQSDALISLSFPYMTERLEKYIDVVSNVLMDTMNSRLFVELRTKTGLVYSVSSISTQLRDVGLFGFSFTIANNEGKISQATNLCLDVLDNIVIYGITHDELIRAKTYITEQKLLALEDTMSLSSFYGQELLLKGKVRSYQESIDEIRSLTLNDIHHATGQLFSVSRLNLAILT